MSNYIEKITWEEFIDTGMLLYINQILHAFGLAIAYEDGEKLNVFPIKTNYKGFREKEVTNAYYNLTKFILDNKDSFEKSLGE